MDELDIFKKQWKEEEKNLPHLEYDQIYQMILKKSSSAVKWIFIISILELVLGLLFSVFYHPAFEQDVEVPAFVEWLSWGVYPVLIYFIYQFFRNYNKINTTSSVKELLNNIMKSRRTVRLYIMINLILGGFIAMVILVNTIINVKGGWDKFVGTTEPMEYLILFGLSLLMTALIIGVFLIFYLLLYGFLMRRLNRNYKELKKMEV
ncbi:hypothetical protein E7Z59_10255 [Robertkochia marina]|uniref:Uncharacterized protein n=1 Tax=Robertkochia marina TaxID=1227945 RepID=A0A4S3M317_9FLAO|nr:hypothetical protein [Robertkochia marina]THD68019.1 hypothetical protein E7Z59_10255 [Robertkochia marina]TRZ42696.1 hypothetical protein D3A96_11710 [Robertkochia marina]